MITYTTQDTEPSACAGDDCGEDLGASGTWYLGIKLAATVRVKGLGFEHIKKF